MSTEPLTHVTRPSLPWRDPSTAMTECGLQADSYPSVSRDEASAKWRKMGAQRASLWFCMTCVHTAERWPDWDTDPVGCLGRYVAAGRRRPRGTESDDFRRELLAIAKLIELHRDDFDSLIADLGETVSLRDRRAAALQRRRAFR
jgi:hypothetical protein